MEVKEPFGSTEVAQAVERVDLTSLHSLSSAELAAAIAFLVGSPLQRSQPNALETIQSSLLIANQLLAHGVDPDRIVDLIQHRGQ